MHKTDIKAMETAIDLLLYLENQVTLRREDSKGRLVTLKAEHLPGDRIELEVTARRHSISRELLKSNEQFADISNPRSQDNTFLFSSLELAVKFYLAAGE